MMILAAPGPRTALSVLWGLALAASPARAEPPVDLAERLHLLADRSLMAEVTGLAWRLHEPVPQPLAQSPLVGSYATVIRDGDLFRAWYRASDPSYRGETASGHPGEITCYAESRDGHEWSFPKLGLFEVAGRRDNNVVLAGQPPFSHNFSPFLDTRPGVPPEERYKAVAGHPGHQRQVRTDGLHGFVSADGLRWRKLEGGPILAYEPSWSHAFDSQNSAFWSEAEGCYVCYFRTWAPHAGATAGAATGSEAGRKGELRGISRATSADFRTWSRPVAMNANLPGEHLYTSQTHPYFRAPHLYIALPTRYMAGRVGAGKAHAMLGSTDILLMTSQAGSTRFDRPFTEAFLRPGLDPERWASRANYAALNVVPTGPAEMSIYHARSGRRHTLRTDGFVSLRAAAAEGECRTQPLRFTGTELVLNAGTSAAGSLRVEIQDVKGKPLPGFALADCEELVGDAIELPVRWRAGADLAALAGQPVRLRFVLREADLYALRFRTAD